ncbi:hypothetical protein ABKV19_012968 [Rosa sericea]
MEKAFTLIQTVAVATVFSAVSGWYGFMFGRESARKELGSLRYRRPSPPESSFLTSFGFMASGGQCGNPFIC